jgi:hypothetical protein
MPLHFQYASIAAARSTITCMLSVIVLSLLLPSISSAGDSALPAAAQISRDAVNDEVSGPNVLTGPDFRILAQIMRTDIVRCGIPLTAVLRWHVRPDGVIDDFVLQQSSGNVCFDEIVTLNADVVIKAKLRITPATRNGIPEAAWVPFAVASRD